MDILPHIFTGAACGSLILNRRYDSKKFRTMPLLCGALAGISPDLTKQFGDLFGHSIFFSSIVAIPATVMGIIILKETKAFFRLWVGLTLIVIIAHLLLDYLQNGVALLYPFITDEYSFPIVLANDYYIIGMSLLAISVRLFSGKSTLFAKTVPGIMSLAAIYLISLSVFRIQLIDNINEKFAAYEPYTLVEAYPDGLNRLRMPQWGYMIRNERFFIKGQASTAGRPKGDSNIQFVGANGLTEVVLDTTIHGRRYIVCEQEAEDSQVYMYNNGEWELVHDAEVQSDLLALLR
ncbi:metal-dependent hydrolase [Paenibacillus kobensis]|uniref:metal-dependent hydrolase n=1 Tax=Paenibacillus kobensis TaxID=59841 RepID=UPI000FDA3467|nr:metal-dependent hydrolase [Paenibacillus kobensis]